MAISWMTVLKIVPWGDVIENAPKLATGARNLWSAVASKKSPPAGSAQASPDAQAPDWTPLELQAHVQALRMQSTELQQQALRTEEQLRACANLVASLAEQNEKLVVRLQVLHRRQWLIVAALLAVVGALLVQYL